MYPLLPDDTCHFLAMDFDEEQWQDDALAVMYTCEQYCVPASLEISRSGKGAHIWIFFATLVPAREVRLLGAALISHTCARTRQLSLGSYDRFFPSQDTLPKGGFGNLIALPLQKIPPTGRLIGEGFDHAPLDTLVLAMPISWQGTQYAGRLHRNHAGKADIRIYDYVETDNPQLHRMWKKRRTGYVAMGYQIIEEDISHKSTGALCGYFRGILSPFVKSIVSAC